MRYYLAGPMTGLPGFGYDRFEAIARRLRASGFDIASPHENFIEESEQRGKRPYKEYIKAGFDLLLTCDAIILLSGWQHSKGCRFEVMTAVTIGIPVYIYMHAHNSISEIEPPEFRC